ncbi:MAG: tetraacyldisaccharide 4'-kinase [Chitinophagaceae bacterium]
MFFNWFLQSFRLLLLPFSLVYWLVIGIRNWMYDRGILKSTSFGLPMICVGNLSVGGTGKSPMVEFLVRSLRAHFRVATLSRGYKRKTRGYALANEQTTALEIGDEPMQFHLKFPEIPVAVGEDRIEAVAQLLHDHPETELIILDDALQHRAIQAGLNILLTEYANLYTRDFYLPAGDLRDLKSSARRAHWVVVTKCPPDLNDAERNRIRKELRLMESQLLFFACMDYSDPYLIGSQKTRAIDANDEVLLVTGIANPKPLQQYLEGVCKSYQLQAFSDHHIFTIDDLREIRKRYHALSAEKKMLLTTEKDAVRLLKFKDELSEMPIYVLPVRHRFLFGEEEQLNELLKMFVRNFPATEKN